MTDGGWGTRWRMGVCCFKDEDVDERKEGGSE